VRVNDELIVDNFKPDLILLNNDLSDGIPEILQSIKQPIVPPLNWAGDSGLNRGIFNFIPRWRRNLQRR